MRIKILAIVISLCIVFSFSACNKNDGVTSNNSESATSDTNETEISESVQNIAETEMFTERDKQTEYDENKCIVIELKSSNAVCSSNLVEISGQNITIKDEGSFFISGTLTNGQITVDCEKTDKVNLILSGVNINCDTSAPIYVKQADKVFITLATNSQNTLTNKAEFVAIDDNNIDSVIFSKDDLTINGSGSLNIKTEYGHGIVSKDDLVLTGGNFNITAKRKGLCGNDSVRINGGTYQITSGGDGIHAENTEDASLGFVYIAGGTFSISSDDDGIHASSNTTIAGGKIDITKSYEGIEGKSIDIKGGDISVVASDDGINAAGGSDQSGMKGRPNETQFSADADCYLNISGGTTIINASGDGVDSNGNLTVSGGETYVSGPTNNGNGALDYNGTGVIKGGIFIAAGASGMAQNFGTSSTQGSIMVSLQQNQTSGSKIVLKDSSGNEIASFTPQKAYNCVVVSTPKVTADGTYALLCGTASNEIKMTSLIYGKSSGMGGAGGGGFMGNPRGGTAA